MIRDSAQTQSDGLTQPRYQFTPAEDELLARERQSARQSNFIRRQLIMCIDRALEQCGASSNTRRPLVLAMDEAVEKHLEDLSVVEMREQFGTLIN